MRPTHLLAGLTIAGLGASVAWLLGANGTISRSAATNAPPLQPADKLAASGKLAAAITSYDRFIAANEASASPVVQDQVASARIRKGYALAKQKKWPEARAVLLEAEQKYKGTGKMVPEEGGAKDEAAYQAAVCLLAEGKTLEGKRALLAFIDRYPDSPNTNGAYKRLLRLTRGKERDSVTEKLDKITKARGDRYALEVAKCGPRAVAYIAGLQAAKVLSEDELVRACKTDASGTTLQGLALGLKACGLEAHGYELNRSDFAGLPTPAIWLYGDHFLVVTEVKPDGAIVYDPMNGKPTTIKLPNESDTAFTAHVLTLKAIKLSN